MKCVGYGKTGTDSARDNRLADIYDGAFLPLGATSVRSADGYSLHLPQTDAKRRREVMEGLAAEGIETREDKNDCAALFLPLDAGISDADAGYVINGVIRRIR